MSCGCRGGAAPVGLSVRGATYQVVVDGEIVASSAVLLEARAVALELGGRLVVA